MMDFLVIEAEGLPDIDGGRKVLDLPKETSDKTVAKVMFHHQLHRYGGAPFLAPHLRSTAVVCLLRCRDDELRLDVLSGADNGGQTMIAKIGRRLARAGELVFWDGGRRIPAWLLGRALVEEATFHALATPPLEQQIGLTAAEADRYELAHRFGFECDPIPTDEANWDLFAQAGYDALSARCLRNTLATARLFLRHRRVGGVLTAADHRLLCERLDELATARGPASA